MDASPFLRLDAPNHAEMYTDGFVMVVGASSLTGFSAGALARWARVTPQAVLKQAGGRQRLLEHVAGCLAERWVAWTTQRDPRVPYALPETAAERAGVRAWGALLELARGEFAAGRPAMAEIIAGARARERGVLALSLAGAGPRPADVQVEALMCLLTGVRQAMADAHDPMAPELGKTVVASWLSTINLGSA